MKIICLGRNYKAHARELGNAVPTSPLIFMKPTSALLIDDRPLYYPDFTHDLHYECELVIKIKKNGKAIEEKFAHRYYDEMALGIDFTARDIQAKLKEKGHPWELAKGFDHSAVLSGMVPLEPRHRREGILFSMQKNELTVQQGNTSNMIFHIDYIISYVSQFIKLQIGDYIFTGTPEGVGPVTIGDKFVGYIEDRKMFHCEIK